MRYERNLAAEDEIYDAALQQIGVLGDEVASVAAGLAPKRTGKLADSIGSVRTADGASITAHASYALFVELGTRKMRAQPYLRPALDTVVGGS